MPARPENYAQPQEFDEREYYIQQRFKPLPWGTISDYLIRKMCTLFQVRSSKVLGWFADGLIRIDLKKRSEGREIPLNIELRTPQLAPADIQEWDRYVRSARNWRDCDLERSGSCRWNRT